MASDDDGPADAGNSDPAADQEWQKQESVRDKRGKHGAKVVESTGTIERSFTVTFRSTGKNLNMNKLHQGLLEKIFEAVPGVVFRPTSEASTCTKKSMTTINQFPTTEIGHGNFFERRQKGKTIEVDHKIHSATPIREIKNKIMSYLRPNNIYMERGELDGIELFRFGYLQGAHPRLINRGDIEEKINDAIRNFHSLDDYWDTHVSDWDMPENLPLVSVYKKEIGWGMGASRVTSECVTLMAIRPVCVLYKHIISESKGLLHYDFIPTGAAAMTTAEQMKELLINNNDIQNSVQGISIMGLPPMALELEHGHNNQVKTIQQWIMHHPGVENIERTDDSESAGRWIVVVLRDEYENAKQWIHEVITQIPNLLSPTERNSFSAKYEIFPPALFTNAPLGGKMQKEVSETFARIMAKKDRYSKSDHKASGNAWQKRTPIFFDAMPADGLNKANNSKNKTTKQQNEEVNSEASTEKTNLTRTAQTIVSTDIETIVSRIDTVFSQYSQVFDRLIQDAKEQRIEDRKRHDEERRAREEAAKKYEAQREEDRRIYEQQRLADREAIDKAQAEEKRSRAIEKRQSDERFERLLQEHKTQQSEMLKLVLSIMTASQQSMMSNQLLTPPPMPYLQPFPPQPFPPQFSVVPPPAFMNQSYLDQPSHFQFPNASNHHEQEGRHEGHAPMNDQHGSLETIARHVHPGAMTATTTQVQPERPANATTNRQETTKPKLKSYPTPMADSNIPNAHPGRGTPQPHTPKRGGPSHIELAGQRRRFDQITSTPDSVDNTDKNQPTPEPPAWDETNAWDDDDLSETARNIDFGETHEFSTTVHSKTLDNATPMAAEATNGPDVSMTEVDADTSPYHSTAAEHTNHE